MGGFLSFLVVVAVMTAIAATVLAFIFIVPEKKAAKLKGIGKLLHDVCNFKFLTIEKILQALYMFTTVLAVLLCFVFAIHELYWENVLSGFLLMFVGPVAAIIAVRVVYEFGMLMILLVKNVIQLNNKTKNQNDGDDTDMFSVDGLKDRYFEAKPEVPAASPAAAPIVAPAAAPVPRFCTKCGSGMTDGHCPNGCQ